MARALIQGLLLLSLGTFSFVTPAQGLLQQFFSDIKKQSLSLKTVESEAKGKRAQLASEMKVFALKSSWFANYSDQKTPPTSPFSTSGSQSYEYGLGFEKLWSYGLTTKLDYSVKDSDLEFASKESFSYISPQLQLTVKSSLIQDLIKGRYLYLQGRNEAQDKVDVLEAKKTIKQHYVEALLNLSKIFEKKEEQKIQKKLCKTTQRQSSKLSRKRKRGSVSQKDYLLSLKELALCEANSISLERELREQIQKFESDTNVGFLKYSGLRPAQFFTELTQHFYQKKAKAMTVDLTQVDSVQSLRLKYQTTFEKQKELEALGATDLNMEFRAGLSGLDQKWGVSHDDLFSKDHPFVYVGLKMDWPWSQNPYEFQARAKAFESEALKIQIEKAQKEVKSRFTVLGQSLESDFLIHKQYEKALKLSQSILQEGQREFSNGRLDYYALNELNKAYFQDQKKLSVHRLQLLSRLVEYLDYFNFFESFL